MGNTQDLGLSNPSGYLLKQEADEKTLRRFYVELVGEQRLHLYDKRAIHAFSSNTNEAEESRTPKILLELSDFHRVIYSEERFTLIPVDPSQETVRFISVDKEDAKRWTDLIRPKLHHPVTSKNKVQSKGLCIIVLWYIV